MISNEHKGHKKHADLRRPAVGSFNRNEWALVGGPCTTIKVLADQIIRALSADYNCAYIDSTHNDDIPVLPGRLAAGAVLDCTDQINYTQVNHKSAFNAFKLKETFALADLVLTNGNHHPAKAQVVIIYENKKASLQKRIEQLTNVEMILLADGSEVFDFIKEAVPGWDELPVYRLEEAEKIITFFRNKMEAAKPRLNGLVLTGGKSERMGFDKAALNWHGKEQRFYMADLLAPFCEDVFLSCRAGQQINNNEQYKQLPDTFTGLGPYGGILSAFREKPDSAWLVVACDLPLLSQRTLGELVQSRNISTIATTFQSPVNEFPEPLITIWEPKSYPVLLSFLSQGYSCPRKVLINSDTTVLTATYPEELTNVNTPDDLESVKSILHSNSTAG